MSKIPLQSNKNLNKDELIDSMPARRRSSDTSVIIGTTLGGAVLGLLFGSGNVGLIIFGAILGFLFGLIVAKSP